MNNIQAFPALKYKAIEHGEEIGEYAQDRGMTLRDYFAGQALYQFQKSFDRVSKQTEEETLTEIAELSYLLADAMLKERDK